MQFDNLTKFAPMAALDDEELQALYTWVDEIPLSRPKRNIARDFADAGARAWDAGESGAAPNRGASRSAVRRGGGPLLPQAGRAPQLQLGQLDEGQAVQLEHAEQCAPGATAVLAEMCPPSASPRSPRPLRPRSCVSTAKVFKRLGFQIPESEMRDIVACKPAAVERLLKVMRKHVRPGAREGEGGGASAQRPLLARCPLTRAADGALPRSRGR